MNTERTACLYARSAKTPGGWHMRALDDFAQRKGLTVVRRIEECRSGNDTLSEGILEMLAGAEAKEFNAVVVRDISRLSRNTDQLILILSRLRDAGVELWTQDNSDITSYEWISLLECLKELSAPIENRKA